MTPPDRPIVKLRPKGGRRLAAGAPWVYADEIALDRRTKNLTPGTIAALADADRGPFATVAVNPASTIACRVLDADPAAEIDANWFESRLRAALALRAPFFDTPFHRLVHAEADGLPGLVIDRFGSAVVIQPNAAWAELALPAVIDALQRVLDPAPDVIVSNRQSRARLQEGMEQGLEVVTGAISGPIPTPMNNAVYMADLTGGQKTGLFFDQRPNHAVAARLGKGGRVLDMFSHVGGFALAALAAGAQDALAVDGSAAALALAEEGARASGVADRFHTRKGDAFDVMRDLAGGAERFDLVVCDPPAFAPSKSALEAGLRAYERTARLAARLVAPTGWLCLCSCSHAADLAAFRSACVAGIAKAGRQAALVQTGAAGPDHPIHPALPETGYLKALFFRISA